jgi:hypothetical protein
MPVARSLERSCPGWAGSSTGRSRHCCAGTGPAGSWVTWPATCSCWMDSRRRPSTSRPLAAPSYAEGIVIADALSRHEAPPTLLDQVNVPLRPSREGFCSTSSPQAEPTASEAPRSSTRLTATNRRLTPFASERHRLRDAATRVMRHQRRSSRCVYPAASACECPQTALHVTWITVTQACPSGPLVNDCSAALFQAFWKVLP